MAEISVADIDAQRTGVERWLLRIGGRAGHADIASRPLKKSADKSVRI